MLQCAEGAGRCTGACTVNAKGPQRLAEAISWKKAKWPISACSMCRSQARVMTLGVVISRRSSAGTVPTDRPRCPAPGSVRAPGRSAVPAYFDFGLAPSSVSRPRINPRSGAPYIVQRHALGRVLHPSGACGRHVAKHPRQQHGHVPAQEHGAARGGRSRASNYCAPW